MWLVSLGWRMGWNSVHIEGVHVQTMLNSDILIPTITDALDLFLDEQRLIATLRR